MPTGPAAAVSPADAVLARRTVRLGPDLSSGRAARQVLAEVLAEADRSSWGDAAALALSEVVTNAALHAHTPIEVTVEVRAGSVLVEVKDGSPLPPRPRGYDEQATTGRGMALVAALTDECGVRSLGSGGKVVWFRIADAGGSESASEEALLAAWDLEGDWDEQDPAAPPARTVTLAGMPATLWLAARQHHDAILRELVLYLAAHDDPRVDVARADAARIPVGNAVVAAVEEAQRAGTARPAVPEGHPSPLPDVPDRLTLVLELPPDAGEEYAALRRTLDVAESLAAAGRLLTRPALPEIVAVRTWVCDQVPAQLAGHAPTPFLGAAAPHFETSEPVEPVDPLWDDSSVREADRGVVAADEANRIVAISRPLAALLGWAVGDLVGRRVVTLIPPRLREAHVAGFTRHLTTGEAHVLGVPLVLPVLHADGRELACRFLVERAPSTGGRSVYLAFIEPADPAAADAGPPAR